MEPEKLSDLMLIEGDPLADIRATREIRTVILGRQVIDTGFDPNFRNPMPRPVALVMGSNIGVRKSPRLRPK